MKQEVGQPFQAAQESAQEAQAGKPALLEASLQAAPQFYRRRLPHWQPDGAVFFLTWRLQGSLPREAVERLRAERGQLMAQPPREGESPRDKALRVGKALFGLTDASLGDALKSGYGPRWLEDARVAGLVQASLYYWHGNRYELHRYVIMPNHVHVLLEPLKVGQPFRAAQRTQAGKPAPLEEPQYVLLRKITQGVKGYTARETNRLLGRRGVFWQDEGFDHWIRDGKGYLRCVDYIDRNPVEAGLCATPEDWPWGSAGEVGQPFQAALLGEVDRSGETNP